MIHLTKLILASASPRRAEILRSVGWEFTKDVADIDETELPGETADDYVQRLAREKAAAVARRYASATVLGADTTVVINDQIIGKPKDLDDARQMLEILSGNWHEVLTGVAIIQKREKSPGAAGETFGLADEAIVDLQKTRVKFAEMSGEEIEFLVAEGAPLDKAGAYAVQAQAALFIEEIEGDYWNVVGLPISLLYRMLKILQSK
jgi:septum formation protein